MKKEFLTVTGLLLTGFMSVAQETDSVRYVHLQEVQVVSTRATQKTPVAFSTISKEQIKTQNFGQDIPFLMTLTPSVVATSDAGTGIGYTGVRVRGTDATRINITTNGVPLNDAESHSLFWVNTPDLASSVEDIQIQRGAGTSTNGAGAFGASINMKTESVSTRPYGEISGTYGSFNTHKEVIKVGTGLLNGHWGFDARLSNIGSDGYIDRASSDLKSYFFQGGYYGDNTIVKFITFGGKEKTYHAWNGVTEKQMKEHGRRYNSCGEIENEKGDIIGFYNDQNDNYLQTNYQLLLTQRFSPEWNLNITLHYTDGEGYYQEYKNGRSFNEYGLLPYVLDGTEVKKSNLVRQKRMDNGFGGGVFSLNYTGQRLKASFGGAANHYDGDHFGRVIWVKNYIGNLLPDHEYYHNKGEKTDVNFYLKGNYELVKDRLNLYADLQYRHINYGIRGINDKWDWINGQMQALNVDNTYDFFNPKVGLFYQINRQNSAYASFSIAQKEPTRNNFTDAKFGVMPSSEKLFDYEAGYTFTNSTFLAGVNFYYMKYKDQLILTGETNDIGEPLAANVPDSYRTGFEFTLGAKITPWLSWNGNLTLSRNRIQNYTAVIYNYISATEAYEKVENYLGNTPISFSPDLTFNSLFSFNLKGFSAGLQSLYVGSQYVDNTGDKSSSLGSNSLDDYFVNNLRVGYTFPVKFLKSVSVNVLVNNIFNAQYISNGSVYSSMTDGKRSDEMYYFPQAGTNVLANLTVRF